MQFRTFISTKRSALLRLVSRVALAYVLGMVSGVQAADKGASSVGDSDEAALVRLRSEIMSMIGDPVCTNLVYCRVLALGSKPCGKPDEYLAYSATAKTNEDLLNAKAAEYAFVQEEILMANKPSAACVVPPKPRVQCIDQRCKLQP